MGVNILFVWLPLSSCGAGRAVFSTTAGSGLWVMKDLGHSRISVASVISNGIASDHRNAGSNAGGTYAYPTCSLYASSRLYRVDPTMDKEKANAEDEPHRKLTFDPATDAFYDKSGANILVEARAAKDPNHLSRIEQDSTGMEGIQIDLDEDAQCWRLVMQKGAGDETEEMIFTTGAIGTMDLPPAVTLTGLGSTRFEGLVEALKEIGQKGEREFRQGYDAIELSNRYFRPRGKDYRGEDLTLSPDVDPNGILKRVAGDNMVHTEDNEVSYFRGMIENGKKRYVKAKPQIFRIGDIVEAQCSVVFVKCKGAGIRMKVILRALALVNCEYSMDADRARRKNITIGASMTNSQKMKCKIGFEYSDDEEIAEGKRHNANQSGASNEIEQEGNGMED
ncbi:hypothetical protein ARMSODRAFT_1057936 [Armillaria solidipes]|uniref:Uncharacterized protein n=1 Tax=Armillaria solidipes TaxID=1076256 RepID=A0A2H3AXT6_9AGAR|nr:hypothetical protein ARMSODRAFT_1057936 [Armillaria solidipes]